jgi:hypothetical protein
MSLLAEFPKEVIDSHALVVAEILAGEQRCADTLLELAAEALVVDKLAVLMARQARFDPAGARLLAGRLRMLRAEP